MHNAIDALDARLSRDFEALRAVTEDRLPSLAETERRLHERLRGRGVTKRRMVVAGALVAACGTALAAPLLRDSPSRRAQQTEHGADAGHRGAVSVGEADRPHALMKEERAKRDALRREIVRHAPASAVPSPSEGSGVKARAPTQPASGAEHGAGEAQEAAHLKNKMGPGREKLAAYLNAEFSPLLGECIAQARARAPEAAGMYAIGIETLADGDLGAVVDVADPAARNEIADPLFFECVRESAFTLVIPPPLTTGQEKFEITGYFGDPPVDGDAPKDP